MRIIFRTLARTQTLAHTHIDTHTHTHSKSAWYRHLRNYTILHYKSISLCISSVTCSSNVVCLQSYAIISMGFVMMSIAIFVLETHKLFQVDEHSGISMATLLPDIANSKRCVRNSSNDIHLQYQSTRVSTQSNS